MASSSNQASSPMSTAEGGGSDLSDDDDLIKLLEQDKRRSERLMRKLDSDKPMTSTPPLSRNGTSVFGMDIKQSSSKSMDRQMKAILRDRNKRDKIQRDIQKLRVEINEAASKSDGNVSDDEKIIADMAMVELRNEEKRLRLYEKYHCAIGLFLGTVRRPTPSKSKWEPRVSQPVDTVQELLMLAHREDCNLHQRFPALIRKLCETKRIPPQHIGRMLFYRVVYDPLEVDVSEGRQHELKGLLEYIPFVYVSNVAKLPSMVEVLRNYGAILSVKATSPDAVSKAPKGCLDKHIIDVGEVFDEKLKRCLRNLSRAFQIWTELVKVGANYSAILGESRTPIVGEISSKTHCCLAIAELCVQILLSPFGSRLGMAIEPFLTLLFAGVERTEWIFFRQKFALFIALYTTRLGLHVDLVEHLLPSSTDRTCALRLDVAYMILARWYRGPVNQPEVTTKPVAWPVRNGPISFRLADVLVCMEGIPDLTVETDETWLLLLARLIRIVVVDFKVLATKKAGQLAKVQSWEKKMRWLSHRNLSHGVEKHCFQYCLNTLITTLTAFVGSAGKRELRGDKSSPM